jgi:hypothetical protein
MMSVGAASNAIDTSRLISESLRVAERLVRGNANVNARDKVRSYN